MANFRYFAEVNGEMKVRLPRQGNPGETNMMQIEDRAWVEQALHFWTSKKPNRHTPRRIISWNVEQLTAALKRLDEPKN